MPNLKELLTLFYPAHTLAIPLYRGEFCPCWINCIKKDKWRLCSPTDPPLWNIHVPQNNLFSQQLNTSRVFRLGLLPVVRQLLEHVIPVGLQLYVGLPDKLVVDVRTRCLAASLLVSPTHLIILHSLLSVFMVECLRRWRITASLAFLSVSDQRLLLILL